MTYQVIARKWRPQTFEEVTGQEPITRTLRNAIEHERLHHAYLFSGARGVGKTTTARLLAKALNCHKSDKPTATPCAVTDPTACPSCREIAEGRSIDVLEIDAASNTGVDNVRESIINTVGVRPARDRYKVFIIDEVHMLSGAAFNALLKTLEEPPSRVVFIMATTEAHKLPDTILSRCQQFEFRTIPAPKIADRLRRIADVEGINIAEEALGEIARAGEGSMRDAQSAFDQVISFSGERITTEDVEAALGLASTELLRRTMRAVADQMPAETIAVVEDLTMRGHDLRNFTRDLLAYVRDLLTTRIAHDGARAARQSDAEATADGETIELAARFSESDLVRFFHSLTQTEKDLRESAHPRYQLEVGLVKLIEMGKLARLDDVLHRLTELEEQMRGGVPSNSGGGSSTPPTGGSGSGIPPRRANSGGTGTPRSSFSPPTAPLHASHIAAAIENVEPPVHTSPLKLVAPTPQAVFVAEETAAFALTASASAPEAASSLATSSTLASSTPAQPPTVASAREPYSDSSPLGRIMAELERRRPFVAFALGEAQRVVIEGNELCIALTPKTRHLRDNLTQPESRKALVEVCREVTGCDMGLKITIGDPQQESTTQDDAENDQERARRQAEEERAELWRIAEEDPTIKEFKRIFRGEIIDVWRAPVEDSPEAQG